MEYLKYDTSACSVQRTMDLIGDRWTFLILRDAFWRVRRFDQFQKRLGIARNILSDRLDKLVEAGIMERVLYQERPERYEYRLTEAGKDLHPVIVAALQWGDRHLAHGEPPVVLRHECGELMNPKLVCDHCGGDVNHRTTRGEAGPGARLAVS